MRNTQRFNVMLPDEMAKMIRNKVSSGEYASESEVIRAGLRALQAREESGGEPGSGMALDTWLRTEIAAAYDAAKADPERMLGIAQVRRHLAEKRKRSASA